MSGAAVVVVGGGHAGVEAAAAAARLGAEVTLVTLDVRALVRLSCNPAIGGIGKSHLVREIDALGGVMAVAADRGGIHFRVLNASRGPAVQGPRIQQDFDRYPAAVQTLVEAHPRIELLEDEAVDLVIERDCVVGIETARHGRLACRAAIVTTGTFLGGLLYHGDEVVEGGRRGEEPASALSAALSRAGLALERFKTGTPPRIEARSLDLSRFTEQPGDARPVPLSFRHFEDEFVPDLPQRLTYLAKTNPETHALVRNSLDRSPLYTGKIRSKGPRYCPSFEDKVVKFADRDSHLLHLEPMGLEHPWYYLNGLSTSLPAEIQEELVHGIEGFESAVIAQYGYAVEYDYAPPTQLRATLESRAIRGLFLAGQICGTTGYEEAAGLGIVAGINAGLTAKGEDAWAPSRHECYLGVMVDDLTGSGVLEPYRMFTSRAELRLSLAPNTADRRLCAWGHERGLVDDQQAERSRIRWERIENARSSLDWAGELGEARPRVPADRVRQGEHFETVLEEGFPAALELPRLDRETLAALLRYRGYLDIERREAAKLARAERTRIPDDFDYCAVQGLSHEVRQRLEERRPGTLGQASRIPGLTPAAIALLGATLDSGRRRAS